MNYSIKQNHPIFKSASTVELNGIVYTLPVDTYYNLKYLVEQLDKYGERRGGIRYPEDFPTEWQHAKTIWDDLEPFKKYAMNETYRSGE